VGHDHAVTTGEFFLVTPKHLPDYTLDPISLYRTPHLPRNDHAQAPVRSGNRGHGDPPGTGPRAQISHPLKFIGATYPRRLGETLHNNYGMASVGALYILTPTRPLPLARRLEKILRPLFLFIL
jgi:hypothetical protein